MAFTIKQNDIKPWFVVALKDDFDTTPTTVPLTTASSVLFNMRTAAGSVVISRGSAAGAGSATGIVEYRWGSADTALVGAFQAEVEVMWPDGSETYPNDGYWDVTVVDDIA